MFSSPWGKSQEVEFLGHIEAPLLIILLVVHIVFKISQHSHKQQIKIHFSPTSMPTSGPQWWILPESFKDFQRLSLLGKSWELGNDSVSGRNAFLQSCPQWQNLFIFSALRNLSTRGNRPSFFWHSPLCRQPYNGTGLIALSWLAQTVSRKQKLTNTDLINSGTKGMI